MYAQKIDNFLKLKQFDEPTAKRFVGHVLQYFEATKNQKPTKLQRPEEIITNSLGSIEHLKMF